MALNASEYKKIYRNLPVPITDDDGNFQRWKSVDINKYLLARGDNAVGSPEHYNISNATKGIGDLGSKIREYFAKGNKELKVVVGLAERGERIFRSVNEASYYALKGYWGKACPEELQITLQLVLRFGISDELGLQRYCDEATDRFAQGRIGLDCNGFVGNFLQHAVGGASWDDNKVGFGDYPANNGIRSIMGKLGPELKRSADLDRAQTYVLGLANPTTNQVINQYEAPYFAHIMVTTPYSRMMKLDGKDVWVLRVVESTGDAGVTESDYILTDAAPYVFNVDRGSKLVGDPAKNLLVRMRPLS